MKKLFALLLLFLGMIGLFHTVIYLANNQTACALERRLLDCGLPPGSEMADSAAIAGKKLGSGNGMQWFGIVWIRSSMSGDELSQWYKSHAEFRDTDEISVIRQDAPEIFGPGSERCGHWPALESCWQIRLGRNTAVGTETSLWEGLLNHDLRGH